MKILVSTQKDCSFIHLPNNIDSGTNTQEMVAPQKLLWNPHSPLFLGFREYFTFALQLFFYFSQEYILTFILKMHVTL